MCLAWQVTERLIERICEKSREAGARFLLVCVRHPMQVHPDASGATLIAANWEWPTCSTPNGVSKHSPTA
jgi:hypothetical protein